MVPARLVLNMNSIPSDFFGCQQGNSCLGLGLILLGWNEKKREQHYNITFYSLEKSAYFLKQPHKTYLENKPETIRHGTFSYVFFTTFLSKR